MKQNQLAANSDTLVVGLVGTYVPDGRMSMMKYTDLLKQSLISAGIHVVDLSPMQHFPRFFGRLARLLDKLWFMFIALRFRARHCQIVHIIDQGDARYASCLVNKPVVVTCHDLYVLLDSIAQIGGDSAHKESTHKMPNFLLRKMTQGLLSASGFVCVSATTKQDLERLYGGKLVKPTRVIYNGFGYPFRRISQDEIKARLFSSHSQLFERPFILHIGQNMERKNRKTVLEVAHLAAQQADIALVVAGDWLSEDELNMQATKMLGDKVIQIHKPTNEVLEALYNLAHCLVFPSYFEGFGWPVIEAQACGCPVICSNTSSLPEVAGTNALVFAPDDAQAMSAAVLSLCGKSIRNQIVEAGSANLARFKNIDSVTPLKALYGECVSQFKALNI